MGVESREKKELGTEEAEKELTGPGGAWPLVGEQNPRRGSGASARPARGGETPRWGDP